MEIAGVIARDQKCRGARYLTAVKRKMRGKTMQTIFRNDEAPEWYLDDDDTMTVEEIEDALLERAIERMEERGYENDF